MYLHIPYTARVVESRVHFSHFLQILNIPHIQAVVIIYTRQPEVSRVVGHRYQIGVTDIWFAENLGAEKWEDDRHLARIKIHSFIRLVTHLIDKVDPQLSTKVSDLTQNVL